jgi:hypothetical protein
MHDHLVASVYRQEVAMAMMLWKPGVEVTRQEKYILKRCRKKRKLFAFLRENRHRIFDEALQGELLAMYRNTGAGKDPVVPALMAMALILQGYLGVSDADAVELTVVDLRWQMVLGCLGERKPAFSQGALFEFRERLIAHDMDRRLLERTAEIAQSTKGFDARKLPKTLRIAIDSSPLQGAGRVEDTINLIGHAARKVVDCVAELLDWEFETVCQEAGIPLLLEKSVKKALDRDWSVVQEKAEAVDVLARQVLSLERWIDKNLAEEAGRPPLERLLAVVREIMEQDLEPDPDGSGVRIVEGVAKDRRISVEDGEMRHGRKSKSKRIDGYKRHVATDLDSEAILACSVTPANRPEHEALPELKSDIDAQSIRFAEAHFDRGYMASPTVPEIAAQEAEILCKPWKTKGGELFTKEDFELNLRSKTITCPAGHTEAIEFGRTVKFDPSACDTCPLRCICTEASPGHGRTVSIAQDERLQKKLREAAKTKSGRQRFRERVPVEHRLAHIGQRQGRRARYIGTRKNLYDLRRAAAIQNLETAQRKAA